MAEKSEIRDDGSVYLLIRHRKDARANPESDKPAMGLEFTSREHFAKFMRTFRPPNDDCYYDLRDFDLSGLDLGGAKLAHAAFAGADLTQTKLCNADMPCAGLRGAVLGETDMTGANVDKARVDDQVFGPKVICASETFNNAVNKPTKSEKKAMRRMTKRSPRALRR